MKVKRGSRGSFNQACGGLAFTSSIQFLVMSTTYSHDIIVISSILVNKSKYYSFEILWWHRWRATRSCQFSPSRVFLLSHSAANDGCKHGYVSRRFSESARLDYLSKRLHCAWGERSEVRLPNNPVRSVPALDNNYLKSKATQSATTTTVAKLDKPPLLGGSGWRDKWWLNYVYHSTVTSKSSLCVHHCVH